MVEAGSKDRVVPVPNLLDYFRTSIESVMSDQGVEVRPHTAHYVVNLLTLFSRSDEFYDDDCESRGLRPLALMLADAAAGNANPVGEAVVPFVEPLNCERPCVVDGLDGPVRNDAWFEPR